MTPERWQRVTDVVADALEHETKQRAAFVAETCGADQELRAEVESMLGQGGERIERVVGRLTEKLAHAPDATLGVRLGAYEIVREIGRGGMGAVYLATRADDEFQKEVAIKLLKRGTDTDEVLRRFRAERQILARLEHPNIARLLDGGTTEDGLPYFVMEYVSGARITDYCFANALGLRDRLKLFTKVCRAVQFAHQNLVVHRDLKPANILITPDGEPKLLDFGIAKLLGADELPIDVTAVDRQRLTPAYASPEQVRGEPITTVSDVYAMGALLYELLAGSPPHRFSKAHPSPTELLRVVGEVDPVRPSAVSPAAHNRLRIPSDLDRIVLKALRKEPQARYPGVGSFADDINRYLNGLPVRARAATFGYRMRKFASRNKAGVTAGAIAVIALVGGAILTMWNAHRAELEAHRAEVEARRAARHFQDVRQLANAFLFEFHDSIATLPGSTAARQLIVNRALEYLDKLAREAAGDHQLQLELAEAYLKVGDVQGKPYSANLGDPAGALRSYHRAIEIAGALALSEMQSGRTSARSVLGRAFLNAAAVQARSGRLDEATQSNTRALEISTQLLADDPAQRDDWQRLIAAAHLGLGDAVQAGNHERRDRDGYRAAEGHYRNALPTAEALVAEHPANVADLRLLAKVCSRIAGMLPGTAAASADEAFAFHRRNRDLVERALQIDPGNGAFQRNLADALISSAYAHLVAGRDLPEALQDCERALSIETPLAAADPSNREAQQDLNYAHYVAGSIEQALGNRAAAAAHFRRSIEILQPLVAANPENVETAFDLEHSRRGLAETQQP